MNLTLDPPSGYADSYMDIQFTVTVDEPCESMEVKFVNKNTKEAMPILAVLSGRIVNETAAIDENTDIIDGYFNLFSGDKTNRLLNQFSSVSIECSVTYDRKGKKTTEVQRAVFYNESKSLDAEIVPFDINIENTVVDIENGIPLKLQVIGGDSRYELSLQSSDGLQKCSFEFIGKGGPVDVTVPAEIICAELELKRSSQKTFQMYYTKFEGLTETGYVGRKYVPIIGAEITFTSNKINLQPQERMGPTGKLNDDFLLSDMYLVHTHRNFTAFGSRPDHIMASCNFPRFFTEAMEMRKIDLDRQGIENSKEISIRSTMRQQDLKKQTFVYAKRGPQAQFFQKIAKQFSTLNKKSGPLLSKQSSGCSGCQRQQQQK